MSFTHAQGKKKSTQTNNMNNKTKTDRQHTYLIKKKKKENAPGTKCADDNLSSLNRNIDKNLWKIIQTMR